MRTALVAVIALLTACGTPSPTRGWISVDVVSGIDRIGQTHLRNTLELEGIPTLIEGSVMYGISVPPAKAELARAVLRADERSPTWDHDAPWEETELGYPLSDPRTAELDPAVRAALADSRVVEAAKITPVFARLQHRVRPYRGPDRKLHDGHEIKLHLEGRGGTNRLDYQTLEDGRGLQFVGGHATGTAARR